MTSTMVLGEERVQRALTRVAYEIVERNEGIDNVVVVGILRRGVAVAEVLATALGRISGEHVQVHELDTSPCRDDQEADAVAPDSSRMGIDVTDRDVVLVDDVLFTGRTVRAALDALVRFGRPRTIQLAVLVDRGHREYPIRPDYVGRTIQTKHQERVSVRSGDGPAMNSDRLAIYIEEED